ISDHPYGSCVDLVPRCRNRAGRPKSVGSLLRGWPFQAKRGDAPGPQRQRTDERKILSKLTEIRPMIYMITDGTLTDQNFLTRSLDTIENVTIAIRSGVSLVQLR